MEDYWNKEDLMRMGVSCEGDNIYVSKTVRITDPHNLMLFDNTKIHQFCVLHSNGPMALGPYLTVLPFCYFNSWFGLVIKGYTTISARVSIYSASDDYSGEYIVHNEAPDGCNNILGGVVTLEKGVVVGTGSSIVAVDDLVMGVGSGLGAHSFLKDSVPEYELYAGVPAKFLRRRDKGWVRKLNIWGV